MAQFIAKTNDIAYNIGKFLGVNECSDGDTNLKLGEASNMQNFKITDNGALQLRGGTKNVAGLLSAYSTSVAEEATTVLTELNAPVASFTAYPTVSVSAGGVLVLAGTPATVAYANLSSYEGYYWRNPATGLIYEIGTCVFTPPSSGTIVSGGSASVADNAINIYGLWGDITTYSAVSVSNGTVFVSGTPYTANSVVSTHVGRYLSYENAVYRLTKQAEGDYRVAKGNLVSCVGQNTYEWKFNLLTAIAASSDVAVRGMWSGRVGAAEYIVAACNGFLWSLTEADGAWTKTQIGAISTAGSVHMFGFDGKLYILDGTQYRVWNGTTLSNVTGYRPLVAITAAPTTGGGTTLEGVNKLNGLRRIRFSSTGGTTFQLPEKGLTSIDYVKYVGTGATIATATLDLATGLVTTSAATTAGTDNIEIGYTFPTNFRASVAGMKYSETYNGETDTRVFLYGDGSNKAFYSGIQHDTGNPSAEYFPDLNEIAVDRSNSPITSMIKHYDRLLTFKPDGAFVTNYGTIALADGTTTAAFYTSPLNRALGNVAMGQVVLVRNNPFTLFGRSAYEWQLSSLAAKDERNAKRMSDRVSETLAGMDLTSAMCFDDELHTEYYVVQNGTAVVYNYTADAWYIYRQFPAVCMIAYKQEVYYGTADGYIRHFSRDYMNDNGTAIEAYWESGSMDFGAPHKRKYSKGLWIGIKPEANGEIKVTAITDKASNLNEEESAADNTEISASGFFDFLNLDFTKLSFNVVDMPRMDAHKIKAKKFTYYKLIFSSTNINTTATVTNAEIAVRYTSNVR